MNEGHAFFDQMATERAGYLRLADVIHEVLAPAGSAIDIGCGLGIQTAALERLGWDVVGADAAECLARRAECSRFAFLDLTVRPPAAPDRFETVLCTETAEHVPAYAEHWVVEHVALRAKRQILWSAAPPGQEWEGHVNLRPREDWLNRFRVWGWFVDEARTARFRDRMREHKAQHWGARDNFFILQPH